MAGLEFGIMKNISNIKITLKSKIIISLIIIAMVLVTLPFVVYLKVLPDAVSNPKVQKYVQDSLMKSAGLDVEIKNPVLKTELAPNIGFKVEELSVLKDKNSLLTIKNLDAEISFEKIFDKHINIKKIGLDYLFADVNKLTALAPPQKETPKSDWFINFFDSLLSVKKCLIVYKMNPETFITVTGEDIKITDSRNPKFVHFDVKIDINIDKGKNKENLRFALADKDNVFIKNRKLFIEDFMLSVNNSKIFINAVSDEKNNFNLIVSSKKFDIKNVVNLVNSNLLIPNGNEILAFFKNIKGDFDFNVKMTNKGMNGDVKLNKLSLNILPLNELALSVNAGNIKITNDEITLEGFKGRYGTKKSNQLEANGTIKDYMKSVDTEIIATGVATNEFSKNHLSKVIGYPIELVGEPKTKIILKSVYNKMDLVWMFKLAKGQDVLIDGASLTPPNWDRALKADLHFEGNQLNIKSINYYIASEINKNSKIKPILTIDGNVALGPKPEDVLVQNIGFTIPKPLPSEFLNVLIGQRLFKKGTIAGHLQVINTGKYPVLDGTLSMEKVRIPSQRLSIKEGKLTADKEHIHLNAFGRFKRSEYKLSGNILNEIKAPVVVKNINLTVNDINVEKLMKSFNNQNTSAPTTLVTKVPADDKEEDDDDDAYVFDTGLLIVEECILNVVKGVYKEIHFGNIIANLTLDKDGILEVKSNKFDIAEGISTLKVYCDLKKQQYHIRLGVKDINSDIMATSLLALKREISGKASGLIELRTDNSLKMNGTMKFAIKNGTIAKVGLVEYALKFASLFRNPMAMISPSTLVDLVNVPEGNFDKISGELLIKDNVIEKIKIKSSSPQLSSYIAGRFDLENRDASLRIYTKFSSKNKGFAGFMRNISLNSLANRTSLSSRNDTNYYSAELSELPPIEVDEKDAQIFLTKVDGDVERFNFLSSLKKIK